MIAEGLSEEDAYKIIQDLGPEHYQEGPMADDDGTPGEVWTFFYPYVRQVPLKGKILLYIKLKIWIDTDSDAGIVMSFHDEGNYE